MNDEGDDGTELPLGFFFDTRLSAIWRDLWEFIWGREATSTLDYANTYDKHDIKMERKRKD